jgi:hypothetical protein
MMNKTHAARTALLIALVAIGAAAGAQPSVQSGMPDAPIPAQAQPLPELGTPTPQPADMKPRKKLVLKPRMKPELQPEMRTERQPEMSPGMQPNSQKPLRPTTRPGS